MGLSLLWTVGALGWLGWPQDAMLQVLVERGAHSRPPLLEASLELSVPLSVHEELSQLSVVPHQGAGQGWISISTCGDVRIQSACSRIFGAGRAG